MALIQQLKAQILEGLPTGIPADQHGQYRKEETHRVDWEGKDIFFRQKTMFRSSGTLPVARRHAFSSRVEYTIKKARHLEMIRSSGLQEQLWAD